MCLNTELEHLLEMVCHNEAVASYRDFEELLFPVAQALLSGWQPDLSAFQGLSRQRAGYLVDLLAGWMPEAQARVWRPTLDRLAADSTDRTPGPFFHGDPACGPCEDEVARLWRLTRGLNVARLRQGLAGD
ncbi:MAG: hypothetical protein V2J55_03040 [Candidatus Competibacteraceae bacterium]|jgi:hypothetical protein|nr:hypothetical protein [Candidatus Competibacteraceae bacterium]